MVTDLTGLATANASMLDESTAVVEGMLVARRASKAKTDVFLVDVDALPQTKALLHHRAAAVGIRIVETSFAGEVPEAFGAFVQYPGATGRVWDFSAVAEAVHANGGLVVAAADLLALTLLRSPGALGADVAVGTTQRFGVPLGFGGPHAGYMAVRAGLERQLPGRLVGVSQDAAGAPAYRLSLQTREQHIRREKATSNICTAQVLLAVMAAMYAVYHGPDGLRAIATQVARRADSLASALRSSDLDLVSDAFFDTVRVHVPGRAQDVVDRARAAGTSCCGSTTRPWASRWTRRRRMPTSRPSWTRSVSRASAPAPSARRRSTFPRARPCAASTAHCTATTTTSRTPSSTRTAARRR